MVSTGCLARLQGARRASPAIRRIRQRSYNDERPEELHGLPQTVVQGHLRLPTEELFDLRGAQIVAPNLAELCRPMLLFTRVAGQLTQAPEDLVDRRPAAPPE